MTKKKKKLSRNRRPIKGLVRRSILFMHRWLTFLMGIVLFLVAGSGAALVYQHEIDYMINEDRYPVTSGDIGWQQIKENIQEAYPDKHLYLLWWPRWNVPVYEAQLYDETDGYQIVAINPETGEIIQGEGEPNRIMGSINSFHTTLLSGEIGYWLVLASTISGVIIALTGIYLWWPGIKRLWKGMRIRTNRNFFILNYDLHQVAGALTSPFFLLMCVTGIAMAFPNFTTDSIHIVTGEDKPQEVYWSEVKSAPRPEKFEETDRPDYDELLERAHQEVPGAETFYVTFPIAPDDPIHIRLQTGIDPKPFGITSRLAYDQYTGELIQMVDPRRIQTNAKKVEEWIDPLHFGHFWGHTGRILYILTCITVIGLFFGGVYIWYAKR